MSKSKSRPQPLQSRPKPSPAAAPALTQPAHTEGPVHTSSFLKDHWPAILVLMAVSFLLYYQCIAYGYILDDLMVITGNSFTKKGFGGIWDILTTESFEGYFGEKKDLVQGNRYRPLSIMTFAAEYGLMGGTAPRFSHVINIILYGLAGVVLMMNLDMMFRNFKAKSWWFSVPFIASLIFILHPVHTEAVANIKGRDEIMSMLLALTSLYGVLRYADHRKTAWMIWAAVSYFLALLSKENAITFLAVIPLTVYFFTRSGWPVISRSMVWILAATVVYLILRFNTAGVPKFNQQITDLMNNPFLGMKPDEKAGTILYTLGKYIKLLLWPHPLSHDYYPYAIPKTSLFSPIPALSLLVYVALAVVGLRGLRSKSVYAYSILFFLATLSIVSNIVINVGTFMNERFIFMASAGFCIAAAYFLCVHLPRLTALGDKVAMGLLGLMVLGLGTMTFLRVPVWENAITLNRAAVEVSPNSARANSFMSTALFEEYKLATDSEKKKQLLSESEKYAQKSVDIVPNYQNPNLMLIGVASERYKMTGNINDYINLMKPVVQRRPDIPFIQEFHNYIKDRNHNKELFDFYLETGNYLLKTNDGRRSYALQFLNWAYAFNPTSRAINESLGLAYELSGDNQKAAAYRQAAQSMQ